ncbi:MAG TPA: hypothetical protein VLT82_07845 [Myxococcaceae bacterium]|nr:hypothetical protein [Myxococcaceae bacterium]
MNGRAVLLALLASVASVGCGAPVQICDGSEGVRLAAAVGDGLALFTLRSEIGRSFLYVDGRCRYGVGADGLVAPEIVGQLDPAAERDLSEGLAFGRWPALAGRYVADVVDTSVLVLRSGVSPDEAVDCEDCLHRPAPLAEIARNYLAAVEDLTARGTEPDGPVRWRAWGPLAESGEPVVDASTVPIDFASVATPSPSPTILVTTSQAEANALRSLRVSARAAGARGLVVRDASSQLWAVDLRSVLPFEEPDGRVHLR